MLHQWRRLKLVSLLWLYIQCLKRGNLLGSFGDADIPCSTMATSPARLSPTLPSKMKFKNKEKFKKVHVEHCHYLSSCAFCFTETRRYTCREVITSEYRKHTPWGIVSEVSCACNCSSSLTPSNRTQQSRLGLKVGWELVMVSFPDRFRADLNPDTKF